MKTLYLIRGISGSGKSTFANELQLSGVVHRVFEADDFFINGSTGEYEFDASMLRFAHDNCQSNTRYWLNEGMSVAVSNTSTTEKEVETYRKIAEDTGAKFVSVVVESRHDGKNVHNIPAEKIEQMKNSFSIKL